MEPNENKNKNSDTPQLDYSLAFESSPNTIHILLVEHVPVSLSKTKQNDNSDEQCLLLGVCCYCNSDNETHNRFKRYNESLPSRHRSQ
jgi:hypothetical protein